MYGFYKHILNSLNGYVGLTNLFNSKCLNACWQFKENVVLRNKWDMWQRQTHVGVPMETCPGNASFALHPCNWSSCWFEQLELIETSWDKWVLLNVKWQTLWSGNAHMQNKWFPEDYLKHFLCHEFWDNWFHCPSWNSPWCLLRCFISKYNSVYFLALVYL